MLLRGGEGLQMSDVEAFVAGPRLSREAHGMPSIFTLYLEPPEVWVAETVQKPGVQLDYALRSWVSWLNIHSRWLKILNSTR